MELLRSYTEITPKLLRNWGPWNYGITPKLWDWDYDRGTMELLRNYSEITPKLWDWDYGRGTMELLRSYTEITPKLLWLAIVLY